MSSIPRPGRAGIPSRPLSKTSSSTVSSLRSRDSHSSAGRNSKNGMCGVTVARCAAAATEMPVFHACGTTRKPASPAMSHTRRASVNPPTRPMSGWTTSTADRSTSCANSCRDDSHSPAAIGTGEAAASLA